MDIRDGSVSEGGSESETITAVSPRSRTPEGFQRFGTHGVGIEASLAKLFRVKRGEFATRGNSIEPDKPRCGSGDLAAF